MKVSSIVAEAAAALRFNKLRSILTIASLAWGVACFVILYAYGDGFGVAVRTSFMSVGQDLIVIFPGQTSQQAGGERSGRKIGLEYDDIQAIRDNAPQVRAISPELMLRSMNIVRGARQEVTMVRAVEPGYGIVRNMRLTSGRWISAEDIQNHQRVAVIGSTLAGKLFGEIPPEGETVTINGVQFQIIGLLRTKTQISNYNRPDNECLFIPYSTASLFHDLKKPDDIVWTPVNPRFRVQAVKEIRAALARLHNFSPNDERAVQILVFNEFMRMIDTMSIALQILLGLIGAMTLAIGGVGLANIMLVSVTQRTREIGVLKSLGATRRAVMAQFMLEAMAIVTLGGLVGVLIGWIATNGIDVLPLMSPMMKSDNTDGDIHLHITRFAMIVSTGVLETVGFIAGLLPALRAARLDPIEALRYE
jgi:putative ABC transport system permease protein